jgi:hypothetical protein
MTYPADDTGNEDAFIRAVAERWSAPVRWVDSDLIPLIGDSERRARLRDDPMAQPFEGTVRALSQVSRELDARVALDGFGGDHIFQVSSASLIADHFFYGRWIELLRTWRSWRPPVRQFARMCLLPHFSTPLLNWVGTVRGKPLSGHWDQSLPRWIVSSPDVVTDLAPQFERLPGEGAAEFESRSGIRSTFVARAMSWNHGLGLDEGVQLRAPLFDLRVVAFAAGRPLSDRGAGGSGKAILRKAMRGLLPDSVLAPRDRKTGTPVGYFRRQLQASLAAEVKQFFGRGRSILQRLGVLDAEAYQRAAEEYARDGVHALGALLHLTLETERWLAVRERGA